ncbi:RNase adaptor protein RapZ [Chelonobacter oris]|uniref:GlmZ(SRNA)-inactivating NTPase n=1 Tax=Chelonobacter oris TaxID=505317 RepID=A0A0A3B8L1_9PAST|nr:RNase adapter RapZ [Chelonobacter oris]KGQ69929.1 glmZ(sRNA)-inactivating NTPase [Chelonobacter oris]MDH2999296.1 RNase adaptor protein RapZ [Chelonobacter oris]
MELIIVSGRSGSGKSVALRALEDIGYYCIDNLPLALFAQSVEILTQKQEAVAISVDIRNMSDSPVQLDRILQNLPAEIHVKMIFLDCDAGTLIRRYSDSRRLHPLSVKNVTLETAIALERELLEPLFQQADLVLDTSSISTHELAEKLRHFLRGKSDKELNIVFESFGFKYGIPLDADYVFDVRFLPNPHWDPALRPMTGLDEAVIDFLNRHNEVHNFIYTTRNYIETWLPLLEQNNRSYLTVAIGCTGGKHRSVYIAQQLGEYFLGRGKKVQIQHTSLSKHKSP